MYLRVAASTALMYAAPGKEIIGKGGAGGEEQGIPPSLVEDALALLPSHPPWLLVSPPKLAATASGLPTTH